MSHHIIRERMAWMVPACHCDATRDLRYHNQRPVPFIKKVPLPVVSYEPPRILSKFVTKPILSFCHIIVKPKPEYHLAIINCWNRCQNCPPRRHRMYLLPAADRFGISLQQPAFACRCLYGSWGDVPPSFLAALMVHDVVRRVLHWY
jgi:hypothetical protein